MNLADFLHHSDRELLLHIITHQHEIMSTLADIQQKNAALLAAVNAESTVIDSAEKLISGFAGQLTDIKAQLDAALAANDPAALQAVADALDQTAATVTAKSAELQAAVVANTPAAPTA